jgi:hypothetical protein
MHKMPEDVSACGCMGPQFNEPYCPCSMRRLNLPPSPERLADQSYWDSPEGIKKRAAQDKALRDMFNRNRKPSEHI